MRRITPRTCLWPITITLLCTFGLSFGLTHLSNHHCFAGVCGEWLFPLQARLHVAVWYSWISISVVVLVIRAYSLQLRKILQRAAFQRKLPLLGKRLTVSGILIFAWIAALYGVIVGIWWVRLDSYFTERGNAGDVTRGNTRLAAIALTGHLCDVTMGMVLLPISRHSALASLLKLSVSTTLTFHMLAAYFLFTLVLIHGFLYVSWLPVFHSLSHIQKLVYPVLNPTYLHDEVWPGDTTSLGIWRGSLVFTGLATTIIMVLIFMTTLPAIRRTHFNLFYFTHLMVIVALIVVCLHASTMFYCTSPGLVLWLLDWAMRIYELRREVEATVTSIGNGYYALSMPMSRTRLKGCSCTSPLAHFYIYHYESSVRELHPFTTTTHLASANAYTTDEEEDITIQFLFRKRGISARVQQEAPLDKREIGAAKGRKAKPKVQWTEKIASQADRTKSGQASRMGSVISLDTAQDVSIELEEARSTGGDSSAGILLRYEGPYFTPADPARYRTVICLVAGTGISGGIAISNAFVEMERQRSMLRGGATPCGGKAGAPCTVDAAKGIWQRCVVVWSVRDTDYVELPFFREHQASRLEFHPQLTGGGRPRMDFAATLSSIQSSGPEGSTWVYLSGPNKFITTGEAACKAAGVDFYGARWEI